MVEPILRGLRCRAGLLVPAALVALAVPAAPAGAQNTIPAAGTECDEATLGAEELVLVFSKTAGFRHDSIPAGIAAIQRARHGERLRGRRHRGRGRVHRRPTWRGTTRSSSSRPPATCSTPTQQAAFERYIRAGGGYVGVHAASDTEYDWPWYGEPGRRVLRQPPGDQHGDRQGRRPRPPVDGRTCRRRWARTDEWYNYQTNPRADGARAGHARRDDATPAAERWAPTTRSPGATTTTAAAPGTRAAGTPQESFAEPDFREPPARRHPVAAAGLADGRVRRATVWRQLPAGRRWPRARPRSASRWGWPCCPTGPCCTPRATALVCHTDVDGNTHVAADDPRLHPRRGGPAGHRGRPGLRHEPLGLPLLLAAAVHPGRRAPPRRRRRPTSSRARASTGCPGSSADPATTSSTSPASRSCSRSTRTAGMCCHVGGDIDFDAAGNLYLSTGDDTNPFESGGYAPIDERAEPQPRLRRAAQRGQHQRPARQDAADQAGPDRRRRTRSRPATCSRRARPTPGPRSTRWASATRSG